MTNEDHSFPLIAPVTNNKSSCVKTAGITCLAALIAGIIVVIWSVNYVLRNPALSKAFSEAQLMAQCQIQLQEIGGALERYSKRNEKYPAGLAELYPNFLEKRSVLHCPADRRAKDVVSYEYTPLAMDAPPATVVVECKHHIMIKDQPPWTISLYKNGRVGRQTYMPGRVPSNMPRK